jgi:hypothetical protein
MPRNGHPYRTIRFIPGHMLSAAIAYQVLRQENPQTIEKVKAALEKHPWYANQWQARLQDVPINERDLVLFMQASRWADDIRTQDKAQNRSSWHYINLPFKPEGQPPEVQIFGGSANAGNFKTLMDGENNSLTANALRVSRVRWGHRLRRVGMVFRKC